MVNCYFLNHIHMILVNCMGLARLDRIIHSKLHTIVWLGSNKEKWSVTILKNKVCHNTIYYLLYNVFRITRVRKTNCIEENHHRGCRRGGSMAGGSSDSQRGRRIPAIRRLSMWPVAPCRYFFCFLRCLRPIGDQPGISFHWAKSSWAKPMFLRSQASPSTTHLATRSMDKDVTWLHSDRTHTYI